VSRCLKSYSQVASPRNSFRVRGIASGLYAVVCLESLHGCVSGCYENAGRHRLLRYEGIQHDDQRGMCRMAVQGLCRGGGLCTDRGLGKLQADRSDAPQPRKDSAASSVCPNNADIHRTQSTPTQNRPKKPQCNQPTCTQFRVYPNCLGHSRQSVTALPCQ
jgi:hypothetical protein